MSFPRLFLAAASLFAFTPYACAIDEDTQFWQAAVVSGPISQDGKWLLQLEQHARFSNNASHLGTFILRPSLGYKLTDRLTLSGGYDFFRLSTPSGPTRQERRLWQQASFAWLKTEKYTLTSRTRLEQRYQYGRDDVGVRLRQQLRLTIPLKNTQGSSVVLWSEGFFALNKTDFGARQGLDRWRNFAGVNIPISKTFAIEPGYLNQFINRRSGENRVDHALSVSLQLRF